MTLWNSLNVFSNAQRRAGDDASSSFDPSRTGDPLGPSFDGPAFGFGDSHVGTPAGFGDPRRHPIGFAPPEDETAEPRFRTEISFKRHHEAPRASVTPEEPGESSREPWQTPSSGSLEDAAALDASGGDVAGSVGVEEAREAEAKVPFYKREIGFGRKRVTSEEPIEAVVGEDESFETVAEPVAADAVEVFASEDAPVEDASELVTAFVLVDDVVEAEGQDRDVAGSVEDVVDEPVSTEDVEPTEDADAAEVVVPGPDSATDDASEIDGSADDDHLFLEDTPTPKGRFSSRKDKRAQKSPKRKPSRAGKGRHVVGLKIGASQISAAVVAQTDAGHELVELARRPLAAGIVVDGEIRDVDALSNAVKAFFEEENLPKKDVRIGLASNRIGVRTFDVVGIDDEAQFDNAVRFKAHEVLPVAVHESVLDYRVLEERFNEAGEPSRRVLLVVAPRDQVEPYSELARRAGIKLSGIDLEALGLLRAFVDPKPFAVRALDDTATVVVAIGHESSTLLVAGGGICEFTRVFDWGGSALEDAIATSLEVHPAEAATILRHLSLSGPGRQFDGLDETARAKALDAVRLRLTPFARELVSSLQFYQTQNESLGIGGIVITGGTSHLEGLGEALHQMIGVNVSVGDPLARVVTAGDFDPAIEATIGSMAVPIGLAIDDIAMRGVNLLPKDAVKTRSTRSSMIAIGVPVAAVIPLVAVGVLYMGAHGKAGDRQAELDAVQAEIATLPKATGPQIDSSIVGDEATRATAVASVIGGRVAWDAVFADMARILPANVWLKGLSVQQPEAAVLADGTTNATTLPPGQGQPAPTAVSIDGFTYAQTDVARLLARLATLPSLRRVTLTSSGRETIGKKDVIHFVIVADLNQTGGAS